MNKFFVYVDSKPDGTPFYIGKGKLNRVHLKARNNKHHTRICEKYPDWKRGIAYFGNEQGAFKKEKELIAYYGKENLCNYTDGGEGTSGLPKDYEWKSKLADSAKNQWANPEIKKKMIERIHETQKKPEIKAKMSFIAKERNAVKSALALHICIECGHVTNSRWLNYHQKTTNHVGKIKL